MTAAAFLPTEYAAAKALAGREARRAVRLGLACYRPRCCGRFVGAEACGRCGR